MFDFLNLIKMCADYKPSQLTQTQVISDSLQNPPCNENDEYSNDSNVWGRLLPLQPCFKSIGILNFKLFYYRFFYSYIILIILFQDLHKDETTFGRRNDCDIILNTNSTLCAVNMYSNVHFKIKRVY
jgi:hypothetical protein